MNSTKLKLSLINIMTNKHLPKKYNYKYKPIKPLKVLLKREYIQQPYNKVWLMGYRKLVLR